MRARELHEKAMTVAKEIKTKYLELFELLLEIESHEMYLSFDVISLHLYCTEMLDLSPHIANDFCQVVRKALEVPALAERIRKKKVTISKARKICPVLTNENAKEWLDLASECSCRVIEKAVAEAKPRTAIQESMKYVAQDTLEFKLAVSEEWEALLKETKDLMSQKTSRAVSSEEALLVLMKQYCQKENPVRKAERKSARTASSARAAPSDRQSTAMARHSAATSSRATATARRSTGDHRERSRYRPADVEHAVNLRDQNQCAHVAESGKRCEEKRWLQKHHVKPFSEGGEHLPENIVTLCWAHHKIEHMREFVT